MWGVCLKKEPQSAYVGFGQQPNGTIATMGCALEHSLAGAKAATNLSNKAISTWQHIETLPSMPYPEAFKKLFDLVQAEALKNRADFPVPSNLFMMIPIENRLYWAVCGTIAAYVVRNQKQIVPVAPLQEQSGGIGHPFYTSRADTFQLQSGDLIAVGNDVLFTHVLPAQLPDIMQSTTNPQTMAEKTMSMVSSDEIKNASFLVAYIP